MHTTDDQNEQFIRVDENDREIGTIRRSEAHSGGMKIHRAIWIIVYNETQEIFLQKRSQTKDTDPGIWNISVGGHLSAGQTYEEAAHREFREELGVDAGIILLGKDILQYPNQREIDVTYKAIHNGPFKLHKQEIESGTFIKLQDLQNKIRREMIEITTGSLVILQKYCGIIPERSDIRKLLLKSF